MTAAEILNILPLQTNNIWADIETFLESKKNNSTNTEKSYRKTIKDFCKFAFHKSINLTDISDWGGLNNVDIIRYQNHLNCKYASTTTNQKMSCIKNLGEFLARNHAEIRSEIFDFNQLKEKEQGYGALTWNEVQLMIEKVKTQKLGEEKAILIELAAKTAIRLSALLSLKKSVNFSKKQGYVIVSVYDKGKKIDQKPISLELWGKIETLSLDDTIFHFTDSSVSRMMQRLVNELGIDKNRNIAFHSLKKTSVMEVYSLTNDVKEAQIQGNHSNASTTLNKYIKKNNISLVSLQIGEPLDYDFSQFSKEELITIISKTKKATQINLFVTAEEYKEELNAICNRRHTWELQRIDAAD